MNKIKKSIRDLNLMDDFLFTESMQHEETAVPVAKMIIERATGVKVEHLKIECQKTINGVDTEYHGIRLDVSISEVDIKEEGARTVRVYDIEPNNSSNENLPKRSRYYQSLMDVKLLETGTDYDKIPELWNFWILPYDPFGKNQMIYVVKNRVEDFWDIDYNDGVKKIFLYTDGEYGGTEELRNLLKYMNNSSKENAVDSELEALHLQVEKLKSNAGIGGRYMLEQIKFRDKFIHAVKKEAQEVAKGIAEEMAQEMAEGMAQEMAEGMAQEMAEGIAQEAVEKARNEMREEGIQVLIENCQDLGASQEKAVATVVKKFAVSAEEAEIYVNKYWK